jgi:hypothetical protein
MAKVYPLQIREDHETGELGILIVNDQRSSYFRPGNGVQISHDILEHPATPHPEPYIDELMALGGVIAGRVTMGWGNISMRDIQADIESLATAAFHEDTNMCPIKCHTFIKNRGLYVDILRAVKAGLEDSEGEINNDFEVPGFKHEYSYTSIAGWICRGYQAYHKRFRGTSIYDLSNYLFDRISSECGKFLYNSEEGDRCELHVDFRNMYCWREDR